MLQLWAGHLVALCVSLQYSFPKCWMLGREIVCTIFFESFVWLDRVSNPDLLRTKQAFYHWATEMVIMYYYFLFTCLIEHQTQLTKTNLSITFTDWTKGKVIQHMMKNLEGQMQELTMPRGCSHFYHRAYHSFYPCEAWRRYLMYSHVSHFEWGDRTLVRYASFHLRRIYPSAIFHSCHIRSPVIFCPQIVSGILLEATLDRGRQFPLPYNACQSALGICYMSPGPPWLNSPIAVVSWRIQLSAQQ